MKMREQLHKLAQEAQTERVLQSVATILDACRKTAEEGYDGICNQSLNYGYKRPLSAVERKAIMEYLKDNDINLRISRNSIVSAEWGD